MRLNTKRLLTSLTVTLATFCLFCILFEKTQFLENCLKKTHSQKSDFTAVIEIQESRKTSTDSRISQSIKNTELHEVQEKQKMPENFEKSVKYEKKSVQNTQNADFLEKEMKDELKKAENTSQMENLQPELVSSFSSSNESQQHVGQKAGQKSVFENPAELENEKTAKKIASYKAYVLRKIAMHKNYPSAARAKGVTGKTKLCITIYANGKNCSVKIISSSGHEILDDAAEKSVKDSLPFKKLPENCEKTEIIFSMDFTLE